MKKIFRVKGWFEKKGNRMEFTKELLANSEDRAEEILYSEIGSKHAVKRNLINFSEIQEIEPEDVKNEGLRKVLEEE